MAEREAQAAEHPEEGDEWRVAGQRLEVLGARTGGAHHPDWVCVLEGGRFVVGMDHETFRARVRGGKLVFTPEDLAESGGSA